MGNRLNISQALEKASNPIRKQWQRTRPVYPSEDRFPTEVPGPRGAVMFPKKPLSQVDPNFVPNIRALCEVEMGVSLAKVSNIQLAAIAVAAYSAPILVGIRANLKGSRIWHDGKWYETAEVECAIQS
jgi:hypothetical protein